MMITKVKVLSIDLNFAIKELMELVGYESDDKDNGRFVVTKQPVEIEKAGIAECKNKDAMPTKMVPLQV